MSSQLVRNTNATQISNMKLLVLCSCVAAASANLDTYPKGAVSPYGIPVVQAAKAAHFAAKGFASPLAYVGHGHQGYNQIGYATDYGYAPYALQAHPNGAVTPVDEPAVQAAKAQHFAAKNAEYAAHGLYANGYAGAYAGAYAAPAVAYAGYANHGYAGYAPRAYAAYAPRAYAGYAPRAYAGYAPTEGYAGYAPTEGYAGYAPTEGYDGYAPKGYAGFAAKGYAGFAPQGYAGFSPQSNAAGYGYAP